MDGIISTTISNKARIENAKIKIRTTILIGSFLLSASFSVPSFGIAFFSFLGFLSFFNDFTGIVRVADFG
jgi:hypothetical protein